MVFHWPQITILILYGLQLLIGAAEHGKPKTGENNLFVSIIAVALSFWILWSGGFFTGGH